MMLVFIAGGSCSGKTTLARQIFEKLSERKIHCLSIKMDDYYKEIPEGRDFEEYKENTNFDDPECLDLELLKKHILSLKQGKPIHKPVFDFKTERRIKTEKITRPEILLLEGTSSLYFAQYFLAGLQPVFKIFIDVEQDILLKRRIDRDLIERAYGDEQSIIKKDTEFVRPTFLKRIEPTKAYADLVIANQETFNFETNLHSFLSWLERAMKTDMS